MAFGRALLVLGIACLAVTVIAQPVTPDLLSAGNYLVDGTGVVYDSDFLSIYVNGTIIGTIPIPAEAPTADMPKDKGQAPGLSDDLLGSIVGQLPKDNPLDKVIIGRKMK